MQRNLRQLKGIKGELLLETNIFYDTPGMDLRAGDQALRLRLESVRGRKTIRAILAHKGPRTHGKLKSRSEVEVVVDDPRNTSHLLTALGFVECFRFEKRRQYWTLDGCQIVLDQVPFLGHFIEIEGPAEEQILAVRQKLNLATTPLIQSSYLAMLIAYLAQHKQTLTQVTFNTTLAPQPAR